MPDSPTPAVLTPEQAAKLLAEARDKAQALVERLVSEQAQIEANPPNIPPEAIAEGREAMARAVAAARHTLKAVEDAIAARPSPPPAKPLGPRP